MKKYAFTLHELVDLLSNEMSNSHEGCRVHSFCIISNELGCISLFCHIFYCLSFHLPALPYTLNSLGKYI